MDDEAATANNPRSGTGVFRAVRSPLLSLAFEREQQNDSLRESEDHFRATFDSAAIGMALVAPDGHALQVDHAPCLMLGHEETERLHLTFQHITHPDDLNADLGLLQQVLDGAMQTYSLEKRYFYRDGRLG